MKLDFELSNNTKILLGILAVALIAALATQWGPSFYKLVSNPKMKTKRETLKTSQDLVNASNILKANEARLYQKTGLADEGENTTIFDGNYPASVVRKKVDGIVKRAGIGENYQINYEAVPGKKSERISIHARRNLVIFSYQEKLNAEIESLKDELEAQVQAQELADMEIDPEDEAEALDMFMDAWLGEADVEAESPKDNDEADDKQNQDEKGEKIEEVNEENHENPSKTEDDQLENSESSDESDNSQTDFDDSPDDSNEWGFVSLPDSIPISIRIELIELILPMTDQHLVGAERTLFEKHLFKTEARSRSGFFGIGASKPTTEISFRPNSDILAKFTNLIDTYGEELDKQQLRVDLLKYMDTVQFQIEELTQKLQVAPVVYTPESYTVKMKFKAEIDKLVNLNKIIETTSKWLMVRDLQISVDHKENKINVDVLMIARVYQ